MQPLPKFRYHPDPIASGRVREDDSVCASCGLVRGFLFRLEDVDLAAGRFATHLVCPWCVADGSAFSRLEVPFCGEVELNRLRMAAVPESAIEEIARRTPGANSWQGDRWLVCCGDACAFLGDASREEVRKIAPAVLDVTLRDHKMTRDDWSDFVRDYTPAGDPTALKFVCLHCGTPRYVLDAT